MTFKLRRQPVAPRLLLAIAVSAVCLIPALGCGPAEEDFCENSPAIPTEDDVASGRMAAAFTEADGSTVNFDEPGSWGPGPSASIEAGFLSIIIARDDTGLEVSDLIERGAFPICVPLKDRSETSGLANYVEGGFITTNTETGALSILALEGGDIVGRFHAELSNTQGEALSFAAGSFRVPQR